MAYGHNPVEFYQGKRGSSRKIDLNAKKVEGKKQEVGEGK